MSFRRTANAIVNTPNIHFDKWMEELRVSGNTVVDDNHMVRVAKTILRKVDPKQYLLSHATIVASVDCYAPKDSAVGKFLNRDVECNRRFSNYRIDPKCLPIINNNGDAWERSLLMSTYRTFIGSPNYLEHIQIPELSKGFIVDAIARDVGESCYIDILVATDRKHKMLISDIMSENICAMSMGCISQFTICNKCGNVASDDTQICPCVLYDGKGTKFVDESGVEHKIAELIGHVTVPYSNQFIEASWVKNPAFVGAQRRNILNPDAPSVATALDTSHSVYEIRMADPDPELEGILRAASMRIAEGESLDEEMSIEDEDAALDAATEDDSESDTDMDTETSEPSSDDLDSTPPADKTNALLDKAKEMIVENLVDDIADSIKPKPEDVGTATPGLSDANLNETLLSSWNTFNKGLRQKFPNNPKLIKWASNAYKAIYFGGRSGIRSAGLSSKDLIVFSWIDDIIKSRSYKKDLYQLAINVGPSKVFPSKKSYLAACSLEAKRVLSNDEKQFLEWKGRIASLSNKF